MGNNLYVMNVFYRFLGMQDKVIEEEEKESMITLKESMITLIEQENIVDLKKLLDGVKDIYNTFGYDPILIAASRGKVKVASFLLDNKYVGVEGLTAFTPLMASSTLEMTKLLLDYGANIEASSIYGSPLYNAVKKGNIEVTKLLLDYRAKVEQKRFLRGHTEIVKPLLDYGANIKASSIYGSLLCKAVQQGNIDVTKLLLDYGADINTSDDSSGTPLHISSIGGHTKIVKLLLDYGAKVDQKNFRGTTALNEASYYGHTEIVALLLDSGANIDYGSLGYNSLFRAVGNDHIDVVKMLLERGANININYLGEERCYGQRPEGINIIDFAKFHENLNIIPLLEQAIHAVENDNNVKMLGMTYLDSEDA
jgi:ankyrin repeat protein